MTPGCVVNLAVQGEFHEERLLHKTGQDLLILNQNVALTKRWTTSYLFHFKHGLLLLLFPASVA